MHVKIFLYADNFTLFLSNSNSICVALNVLNSFDLVSGLKPNLNKMQAMYLRVANDHNIGNNVIDLDLK